MSEGVDYLVQRMSTEVQVILARVRSYSEVWKQESVVS